MSPLARLLLASALALPLLTACPKKTDTIVATGEGKELTDADIDREPLALLPGNAVGLFYIDCQKLFASEFGQRVLTIARARTPVPPSAKFDPQRDLSHAYVGVYSMQGADAAAVLVGNFDKAAIEAAADGTQATPLGTPVVKSSYAGRALYTSHNIGFSVLTARTVLVGNETGIRRALDRIKEGRVTNLAPSWFQELQKTQSAPLAAGFDLTAQPITDAARQQLPFLNGLETARLVGNFEKPGINVAGTLTYGDEQGAQAASTNLNQFRDVIASWGWLASLAGVAQPVKQLEAKNEGKDAKVVAGLDGAALGQLLDQLSSYLGVPTQPKVIPVTTSQAVSGDPGVPKK